MQREGSHQEDVWRAERTIFVCYGIMGMNVVEPEDVGWYPIMLVFHGVT